MISAEEQVSVRRDFGLFRLFLHETEAIVLSGAIKRELKDKTIKIFLNELKNFYTSISHDMFSSSNHRKDRVGNC